jgi:iron complex outermembrane receptor protein
MRVFTKAIYSHSFTYAFFSAFFLLTVIIISPSNSFAQTKPNAAISGTVTGAEGNPLGFATYTISGKSGRTDDQGRFRVNVLPVGIHHISVSMVGYQAQTKEVNLVADSTTNVSFVLQPAGTLAEVVITAGRKAESINEVPSSVSILNARQVREQLNINPSVAAILGNTIPGLGTATNKATNSGQTLRGRQVLVLIDGIPQSTPLMNGSRDIRTIDPAVIDRIEVIKGATSIYGNGSAGGIINFITKKPAIDKVFSGTSSIGLSGNLAHPSNTLGYRLSQSFAGTINRFSYVVSGTYNYTGVQRDAKGNVNSQPDGLGENALYNTFIKLGYRINDNSDVSASYNLFRSTQNSDYVNVVGKYGVNPSIGQKGDDPGEPAGTPFNHNVLVSYHNKALPFNTSLDLSFFDHLRAISHELHRITCPIKSKYQAGDADDQCRYQHVKSKNSVQIISKPLFTGPFLNR